ncbi:hypothetical protein LVJ94_19120 [Pendulispora rubella]|uniref:Uncharacterized protein n=1 Tax=Pendulispora rubella TaxID=2741070 RepID=A0ABZ2LEZ5_9BACT
MGRAEKVAKLEALLERVQQRASLPRAHESGQVTTRRRAPVVELAPQRASSGISASTLPPRPAPAIVPSVPASSSRRTPIASPVSAPVSPRAFPIEPVPEAIEPLAAATVTIPDAEPSPLPVAATAALPSFGVPREAFPTPAAAVIAPQAFSEKPLVRVNPEMTAPVSAEEVAAAAARMNKVPTFPDAFPIDARQAANLAAASATSAAVAKSTSNVSAEESVEVDAVFPHSTPKFDVGQPPKDVYTEDGEEPTKPLMHPPRTAPPKAAQQLAEPLPLPLPTSAAAAVAPATDVAKPRPATIPFDAYPASRPDVPPLSDPASPRAMVVPREVENQPAFLSNLRQPKEGGGGALKWVVLLLVLVAAAYGAYALGFLKPLLGEAPPK